MGGTFAAKSEKKTFGGIKEKGTRNKKILSQGWKTGARCAGSKKLAGDLKSKVEEGGKAASKGEGKGRKWTGTRGRENQVRKALAKRQTNEQNTTSTFQRHQVSSLKRKRKRGGSPQKKRGNSTRMSQLACSQTWGRQMKSY